MAEYNVLDIAKYIKKNMSINGHKQLQKLVYYAYAWYLVIMNKDGQLNKKLFNSDIEAWIHGPVSPELYKMYGFLDIYKEKEIKENDKKVLDMIIARYGGFSGEELESISHTEKPWLEARCGFSPNQRCNKRIDDKVIFDYFSERIR